jgi:type I restriction enzyme S subunit
VKEADLWLKRYSQTYNEIGLAQSKLWPKGTLCITIAANIAETAILGIEACFPDSIVGFIPDKAKADARFIKYYIDTIKLKMQNVSRGTTQDNLSVEKLHSFDFLVPDARVQRHIAEILSAYDDLIENNTLRIKILEQTAQMLYREWFVNFRFPGQEKVKMVASELGPIPEHYTVGPLGELAALKSGFPFKSSTFEENGLYGIVTIRNVHDGLFSHECQNKLSDIPEKLPDFCVLEPGDVLMSLTGNIGRACLVYGKNLLLNQRVAKVIANRASDLWVVYFFLRMPATQKRLEQISTGVAQQNLSPIRTMEERVVIPDQRQREHFDKVVSPIVMEMVNLFSANTLLRNIRDFLLPRIVSGEISVEHREKVGTN